MSKIKIQIDVTMNKKNILIILVFSVFLIILTTILSVTVGTRFDWPDNVHVNYGFPFVWSTNILSTISGAANIWIVDITALIMNLGFWLGIMLIVELVLLYFFNKES